VAARPVEVTVRWKEELRFEGGRLSGSGAVNLCSASEPIDAVFTRP